MVSTLRSLFCESYGQINDKTLLHNMIKPCWAERIDGRPDCDRYFKMSRLTKVTNEWYAHSDWPYAKSTITAMFEIWSNDPRFVE